VYRNAVEEPFEHPLRIAEEWAEIDILSGGRALASTGS